MDALYQDNDLKLFAANGAAPLPNPVAQGYVENHNARIWYSTYGHGRPIILLHGGLGHSGNWGYQVPALVGAGRQVVLIDSRGHGRSTRDSQPFSYDLMSTDVVAVMDFLQIKRSPFVGWSDGACIALVLAMNQPTRTSGVFFFGCNMDPSGTKEVDFSNPILGRCFNQHAKDYGRLSSTPDDFKSFSEAVDLMMKTQPNYTNIDLAKVSVPVVIAHAERDEFIKPDHAEYLAMTIPGAELVKLAGVSHFAPLQQPAAFAQTVLAFISKVDPT